MKNRLQIAIISALACSSVLTGCSNANQTGGSEVTSTSASVSASVSESSSSQATTNTVDFKVPEGGFDETKDVTITFYTTMGDTLQNVFNAFLEDFNEIYPKIHVITNLIGGYEDVRSQMNTELASGGTDVNIAYCYPDHVATYNSAKAVISLDNLIEDDTYGFTVEQYNDFVKAFYDEGASFGDGKMYCLPFSKSSEVMYYNKTAFDEAGLSVPDHWFTEGSTDTTSMEYVITKLKEKYPDSIPLGYDSASNLFITMCAQLNSPYTSALGSHYLFNNDTNKQFLSKFKSWYDKGLMTTKDMYGSYTSGLFTSTETQRCFICIGSSAGASYQDSTQFEVEIAKIPQENADTYPAVIQQGPDICIFNSDDPQKVMASWLVLKYFTTNVEFQAQFSMVSGYTPVIKSVFENEIYKQWLNDGSIQAKSTKLCTEQEASYFTSPAFVGSSEARTQVGNLVTQVFKGTDIDTAFADAVATCEG